MNGHQIAQIVYNDMFGDFELDEKNQIERDYRRRILDFIEREIGSIHRENEDEFIEICKARVCEFWRNNPI